ncbi:MAG: hypothetical protein GF419_00400 [Ignavibacteriales bacterium]|nr:hypothetical protein [Ignavibacteriales bacterium]
MTNRTAHYWIERLELTPHPEGGYFREVYQSDEAIAAEALPERYGSPRSFAASIYFLLAGENFSAFHRLKTDELWHRYDGGGVRLHEIQPGGEYRLHKLGVDFENGERPFAWIKRRSWFAAETASPSAFALVGCVTAPGFRFEDFELAEREELIADFPRHRELIARLTR